MRFFGGRAYLFSLVFFPPAGDLAFDCDVGTDSDVIKKMILDFRGCGKNDKDSMEDEHGMKNSYKKLQL